MDSALAGMGSRRGSTGTNNMQQQQQQNESVRRNSVGQGGTRHKAYSIDLMDEEPLVTLSTTLYYELLNMSTV